MKRLLIVFALCLLAALVPTGVSSGADDDDDDRGSRRDSVVGSARAGNMRATVDARGGPSPLVPVKGKFRARGSAVRIDIDADGDGDGEDLGEFDFRGPVTCLEIDGNQAGLYYPIERGRPNPPFDDNAFGVFIYIEDNGDNRRGGERDKIGFLGPIANADREPDECSYQQTNQEEVDSGNYTVRDASEDRPADEDDDD